MARPLAPGSIVDTHTHTRFSDGVGTFEENARAAEAAGCAVLVSTDHLTLPAAMDPTGEVQVVEAELAAHRAAWETAHDAHPDLEMVYGFECDWYPGCEENVERWSAGATVRLGSVHWLGPVEGGVGESGDAGDAGRPGCEQGGVGESGGGNHPGSAGDIAGWIDDLTDTRVWEALGPDGVWRLYAETWCRACASPLAFDTMAHPDLPERMRNEGFAATIDLAPLWDEMAACAHDCGRRVELSTAGWRKGVGDYYPARGLLERFFRAGVPITVGSDGHRPVDICDGIQKAYAHAWDVGYRTFEAPRADGSWERVPLR